MNTNGLKTVAFRHTDRVGVKTVPTVAFKGLFTVRLVLGDDDKRRVVVCDVADGLGVARSKLKARAKRQSSKGGTMMVLPSEGGGVKRPDVESREPPPCT